MFIEHMDALRCTSEHVESWLIVSITGRDGRFVTDGTLGCHLCRRSYPIRGGIAQFGVPPAATLPAAEPTSDAEGAIRIAAMLNVSEHDTAVLAGGWAALANGLTELIPLRVFALNPASPVAESESVSVIHSSEGIPLAAGSLAGVALDDSVVTGQVLASAVASLRTAGRLVAPTATAIPAGMSVLARDERSWVAEKAGVLVPLSRAPNASRGR